MYKYGLTSNIISLYTSYSWKFQRYDTAPDTPYPENVTSTDYLKRQAVKSVLKGEAYYVPDDHFDPPEDCLLMEDGEGGMYCVPDQYIPEEHHGMHEHHQKRHHQHHHYQSYHIAAQTITSTTVATSPTSGAEPIEARAGVRDPSPVQTATA
jgi:hypothetical protein